MMKLLENLPFTSIIGALDYQARTQPNKIGVLYPEPKSDATEYASLTYQRYNNVVNHFADKIVEYLPSSSAESITCGILAVGGIEYLLSQYALLKIPNVIMFPFSYRNSPEAVEHLIRETKVALILTIS